MVNCVKSLKLTHNLTLTSDYLTSPVYIHCPTAKSTAGQYGDVCVCVGFAMNVVALLPYLVERYDEPSSLCIDAAQSIAQVTSHLLTYLLTYL